MFQNVHNLIKQNNMYLVNYAMPVMIIILVVLNIYTHKYMFAGLSIIMLFLSLIMRDKLNIGSD